MPEKKENKEKIPKNKEQKKNKKLPEKDKKTKMEERIEKKIGEKIKELKKEIEERKSVKKKLKIKERRISQKPLLGKKEIEKKIIELGEGGNPASKIGTILKEKYNVYSVRELLGKTITKVLREKKIYSKLPEDLMNLIKKAANLLEHMEKNKKDQTAKYGYRLTISKIRRLSNYYKKKGAIPKEWYYSEETAKLLVR